MQHANHMALTCSILVVLTIPANAAVGSEVYLNQIQVNGTHNSYHITPHPRVLAAIAAKDPELANSLDYTHKPLIDQQSHVDPKFTLDWRPR